MPASNYLNTSILQHFFRNQTIAGPAEVFLALFNDDPGLDGDSDEVDVSEYVRQEVTFIAPLSGITYNGAELDFGTVLGEWGTLTHFAIFSAVSGGNCLLVQELDEPITPVVGKPLKVPAGKLRIEIV